MAAISFAIFSVLLTAYAISPTTTSFDSRWSLHTATSFAQGHWGDLTEYADLVKKYDSYAVEYSSGKPRSYHPIGSSILVLPAVVLELWLNPEFKDDLRNGATTNAEKFMASMIGAAAGVVFFWLLIAEFQSFWIAIAGTAIFSFGTSMWSTATRALWQHGPLVLMFTIAMLLATLALRHPRLIQYLGLALAAAFVIRPTAVMAIIPFTGYVFLFYRQWMLHYFGWAALVAIPWVVMNYAIYDAMFPPYFYLLSQTGQHTPMTEGLAGLLISPSRGLLVYTPVMIFAVIAFVVALGRRDERPLYLTCSVIIVTMICLYATWPNWWGGHSYGTRFLTDIMPFLCFFVACSFRLPDKAPKFLRKTLPVAIAISAGIGFILHGNGALRTSPYAWNAIPDNIDENPARLWDWSDPPFLRSKR